MVLRPFPFRCIPPGVVHGLSCRKEENSRQGEEAGELRETGRESLKFSGMGSVAFDGMPGIEAVHLEHMKDDDEQREAHKTVSMAGRYRSLVRSRSVVGTPQAIEAV